jgi:hypothetical protein
MRSSRIKATDGRLVSTRRRLRLEGFLTVAFFIATVLTAIWPDWIEAIFHVDPDQGNGSLEWAIVVVLGIATVCAAGLAWRDYRRIVAS